MQSFLTSDGFRQVWILYLCKTKEQSQNCCWLLLCKALVSWCLLWLRSKAAFRFKLQVGTVMGFILWALYLQAESEVKRKVNSKI